MKTKHYKLQGEFIKGDYYEIFAYCCRVHEANSKGYTFQHLKEFESKKRDAFLFMNKKLLEQAERENKELVSFEELDERNYKIVFHSLITEKN